MTRQRLFLLSLLTAITPTVLAQTFFGSSSGDLIESQFIRGDANCDAIRDISDPIFTLNFLFTGGADPCCADVVDANADGVGDISDPVYDLNFQFRGGPSPPAPHPDCGSIKGVDCRDHPCNPPPPPGTTIDWVAVGDPDNDADPETGFGAVAKTFRIAKYEVTNFQWAAFLNRVDPHGGNELQLFDKSMETNPAGGIELVAANANGSKYVVKEGRGDNPVVFVNWFGAVRFCNWLHNDRGGPGSTEDGAYEKVGGGPITDIANDADHLMIERTAGAEFHLPNENEWYKAAYFQPGTGAYFDYATQSDTKPTAETPPGDSNSANVDFAVLRLTDVGAYANSPSAYGTFDQCGNVWEWVENAPNSVFRVFRGGSWFFDAERCRSGDGLYSAPSLRHFVIGFRPVGSLP